MELLTERDMTEARRRIAGAVVRTPLVRAANGRGWLKLECLQPTGSYKIRGATNAIEAFLEDGGALKAIVSASAGNFGQALVAAAARIGVPAVIHVPANAARVKVDNLRRCGAIVKEHEFDDWWKIMESRETGDDGVFFHPVCERAVIAGASTIGAEILEDLPEVDTLLVPIGGGGLATGIAQALKHVRPDCRIVAVEAEVAMPLHAAMAAGGPVLVERRPSFIDGMGSTRVLDAMWPLLKRLVDDVVAVSVAEIEDAVRDLANFHHVVAEGAGAAAYAASAKAGGENCAIIVSGGNIDRSELLRILSAGR